MERLLERRERVREATGNGNGFGLTLGQAALVLFGYPTCEASDGTGGRVSKEVGGTRPSGAKRAVTLGTVVSLFGYPTPATSEPGGSPRPSRAATGRTTEYLGRTVEGLFGWATAAARDGKGSNELPHYARAGDDSKEEDQLPNQATHLLPGGAPVWVPCPCCEGYQCTTHRTHAHDCPCPPREEWEATPYRASGTGTPSSPAGTGSPGACLNPYFSGWLMGYPAAWLDCLPVPATRSRKGPGEGPAP